MSRRRGMLLGVMTLAWFLAGCGGDDVKTLPTVQVIIGGRPFTLEVAKAEADQQKGLMHRDSMPADRGMIFVFGREEPREFWMKSTLIPLDIIFLDSNGRVVSFATMKPLDMTKVASRRAAAYAIEINAGLATALGLKEGDRIELPAGAK